MDLKDDFSKENQISQPENLKISLYPHQLTSVYNMEKIEKTQEVKINSKCKINTQVGILADHTGYGKCHSKNTKIVMYDGSIRNVETIKVGEKLLGDDGKARIVKSLCRGESVMYKVSQKYGEDYIINEEHILTLQNTEKRIIDISLKDYLRLNENDRFFLGSVKSKPIDWSHKEILNINKDKEVSYNFGKNIELERNIPYFHIYSSIQNRLEILAGIIDYTSKSFNNKFYTIEIDKFKSEIIRDIKYLLGSLGIIFDIDAKRIKLMCGELITKIPVKCVKNIKRDIFIVNNINIERLNYDKYYGFTLDGNHRYLLGDFTITHNSLSMVSLILRDKMEWDKKYIFELSNTIEYGDGRISKSIKESFVKINTSLLLVSNSLVHQWVKEFSYTDLKIEIVNTKKKASSIIVEDFDVIIVTPNMYNILLIHNSGIAWKRFVMDEPGQINIPNIKSIVAGFYWFITATPFEIYEKYKFKSMQCFIYKLFFDSSRHFLDKIVNSIMVSNSREYLNYSYSMPETYHTYHKCYNKIYDTLKDIASPEITKLLERGNITEIFKMLGGNTTDNITKLVISNKNKELENIQTEIKICKLRNNIESLEKWQNEEKNTIKDIEELKQRYNSILKGDCSICYNKLEQPILEPYCQNVFCGKCILTWFKTKNNCPLCRHKVNINELIKEEIKCEDDYYKSENYIKKYKTKEDTIKEILINNPNQKIIIFSETNNSFNYIRDILYELNINYCEVKGTINQCSTILNEYRYGNKNVIFLNSVNNGHGINLVETDRIILYHRMNPNTITQVIGRARRIGSTKPLYVEHLCLFK